MATQDTSFAIPAGWVGLALNYSIELTGYLKFGVRMVRFQLMEHQIADVVEPIKHILPSFIIIDRANGGRHEFG